MNQPEEYNEVRILDYLAILGKRKGFILIPTLVLAAAAGVFGFLKTPVWEIEAIIQPGIFLIQDSNGQLRETPASEPLRASIKIGVQSLSEDITKEVNLKRQRFPAVSAEVLRNTWFIRIWLRMADKDQGVKILDALLRHLKAGFDQDLDIELQRLETQISEKDNTIKDKRAEIALFEIQKTRALAQIASEEAKIEISEERRRSISAEMTAAKARTDALEEQLKKAIEAQQKANDAISIGLLLFSSQIQNNLQYYNLLDEKMNTEKVLQENSRLNIKSKNEDKKEIDSRIGVMKNEIDNISNSSKLIQERKARVKYAEIIKSPQASSRPAGPGRLMYLLYGGLFGFFVFSAAALFLERRDQNPSRA